MDLAEDLPVVLARDGPGDAAQVVRQVEALPVVGDGGKVDPEVAAELGGQAGVQDGVVVEGGQAEPPPRRGALKGDGDQEQRREEGAAGLAAVPPAEEPDRQEQQVHASLVQG